MIASHRARRIQALVAAAALALATAASSVGAQDATPPAPSGTSAGPKTPLPAAQPRAPQPGQTTAVSAPDPDWPCIQRKIPTLSYGQAWSGPPLDEALASWRDDEAVADLVPVLAARRTSREDAVAAIDRFAKAEGDKKNEKLTLLYAGVFDEINSYRSRVVAGIGRYARKQRQLSERIKTASVRMAHERKDMATQNTPEFQQLEQSLGWDTRIYEERTQALNYVCESPVLLEQLAFDLAREIQSRMD
jgi:hypothetical protein